MTKIDIFKIGCGKFIIGKNALSCLEDLVTEFGNKPYIIGGTIGINLTKEHLQKLSNAVIREHTGACSQNIGSKFAEEATSQGFSVIIGVGGGKIIDLAKFVSYKSKLPIITIPTSIATCVATSAIAIMYTDTGKPDCTISMDKEVDACIADTNIIATEPKRLLISGIIDSMAKLPETLHNHSVRSFRDCEFEKYIAIKNSEIIWEYLADTFNEVTDENYSISGIRELALVNLLLTSSVGGYLSGTKQLALAHTFYDAIRMYFTKECKDYLHGELVGTGLLIQLKYNNDPCIKEFKSMLIKGGIPTSFKELKIEPTDNNIHLILNYMKKATNAKESDTDRILRSMQILC